eukprot:gene5039-3598_t
MGLDASLLSNRITSEDYLLPGIVDEASFSQHRQLADYAGYGEYAPIFESKAFPPEDYFRFQGLDETALFATSVSISNDFAIIGSNGYNIYQGIVHVYTPVNVSHWNVHSTILSPDGPNINFGLSVDHSGKFLIVGANALDAYKGAAYIYQYMNDKYWILTTRLYSPFGVTQGFGFKVAIDGNTAVVATAINDVCIYEYDTTKGSWKNTLKLSGLASNDRFGNSIDVYNNYVVIGAPQAVNGEGIVYVYKQNSTKGWNLDHFLENRGDDEQKHQKQFGYSVSIYNSTLAVGAVGHRDNTFKPVTSDYEANTGFVYLYEFDYSLRTFEKKQDIESPVGRKSYFGVFVNLAKDKLIVGADGTPHGNDTGAAFVYFRKTDAPRNSGGAWQLNYSLPSPAGNKSHFGYAVDICDDFAVSGAYGFDDLRGSVYLIGFPKTEPTFAPTLAPTDSGAQSFNTVTSALAKQKKMMEILGIGVLALVTVLTSACCIYLCCIPVAPKKKKKEEEEESPYTVHSYVGYSEMDEYMPPQAPPPQWMPFFAQMPMMPMMMVPPPPPMMPMMQMDMEKKKMMDEKDVDLKKADENFIRKLFPYKVYGPRGYEEDGTTTDAMDREKREAEKASEGEGEISSSSSSDDEHSVHYTAERQQSRKPFSMETIRESEHEDESSSSSARSEREAAKNSEQHQRALPYTYSSQYNMQGFQQYDMGGNNNTSQFFAPSMHSSDEVSTLSSQPSSQFYGAPVPNPQMFAPHQYPQPPHMQPMMMPPPPQQQQQRFVQQRAPADYSSDSSSQLNAPNYVSMAKQSYAKFKQQSGSVRSGDDDDASVSTMGSSVAPSRPVSVSHSDRVRNYANERSSSDFASTTSNSDDSFVKRAKERYMQFLMKKNMTREEREADDLMREQSYAFLQSNQPPQEDEEDDATVSTMTGTVHSASTGFYSESSTGSSLTQRSSNSFGGVLNLRPTSMQTAPANVMAPPAVPVVAPVVAPVAPSPVAPPMPPVAQSSPARNTLFKAATTDRSATVLGEAPTLRLTKKIEFEDLDEIKEIAPPVRQTSLLASKPVATISGIEERELKEVKPMAAINRPLTNTHTAASTLNIAEALEHEVEEARQKAVEELERARALAQSMAAEDELKRIQDRNRLKEETRLRAEERARAQFALHKQQQQQQQQTTRTPVTRTTVTSAANETLLAAERALASVQQITVAAPTVVTQVVNHTVVNNTVNRVTTQNATVTNTSVTNQTTRTTQPRIEEP